MGEQSARFGELLRRYREAAGWSQEELAERSGLSKNAIGALERGERRHPYPDTLRRLTAAWGLTDGGVTAPPDGIVRPAKVLRADLCDERDDGR